MKTPKTACALALALSALPGLAQDPSADPDWDVVLAKSVDHPRFALRRAATGKLARAGAAVIPAIRRFEVARGRNALPLELVDALARGEDRSPALFALLRGWADDPEFYWRAQALGGLARRGAPEDAPRFVTASGDPSHLMRIEAVRGLLTRAPGLTAAGAEPPSTRQPPADSPAAANLESAAQILRREADPRARLRMALLLFQAGDGSHLGEVFTAFDRVDETWLDDPWGSREAVFAVRELQRLGRGDYRDALASQAAERLEGRGRLAAFVIQNGGVVARAADPVEPLDWSGGVEIRSCRNGDLHLRWTDDGRLGLGLAPGTDDLFELPAAALQSWRKGRDDLPGTAVHGRVVCDYLRVLDPLASDGGSDRTDLPVIHRKCAPGAVPDGLLEWLKALALVLEENDVGPLAERVRARLPQFESTDPGGK